MKLKPLEDRVVVKAVTGEEKTASGIVLPDTAKEKPMLGEIVAVGKSVGRHASILAPTTSLGFDPESNTFSSFLATNTLPSRTCPAVANQ